MEAPKIEKAEDNDFPEEEDDPFLTHEHDKSHQHLRGLLSIDKFEVEYNEGEQQGSDSVLHNETANNARTRKEKRAEKNTKVKSRLRVRYPCTMCTKIFPQLNLFKEHVLTHKPEDLLKQKIKQEKCKETLESQTTLKKHRNFPAANSKKIKNSTHGEEFKSIQNLNSHQVKSHDEENIEIERPYSSPRIKPKKTITIKKVYKCAECDKEFGNKMVYKKHLLIHEDLNKQPENYRCGDCHREFYSNHGLRVHRRNSNCKTKIYSVTLSDEEAADGTVNDNSRTEPRNRAIILKCPDCPRNFPGMLKLDIHLVSVHLKEPKCSQCGKTFPNGPRLFRHHNVHKLPSFKCPHENCNAAFRTREGLLVHQRKHDGILPHICPVCQVGFKTKPQCVLHRIEAHGQNLKPISYSNKPGSKTSKKDGSSSISKAYPCLRSGCDVVFKYEQSLTIHLRKHDGLLPYVCPVCQEAFAMKQECILHRVEVHKENLKKFALPQECQCDTCGATFKNPYTLKNHIKREHSDQKNFCCDICGKKFALEYDFKVHKGYHAGAKSFTCEECGKCFNSKGDLVRHSWSHKPDNEKPFQCELCGKGFVRKVHFVDHSRYHTGEPKKKPPPSKKSLRQAGPVQVQIRACKFCGKAWTTKDGLRSHLRRVHGRDSHGNLVGIPKPKLYYCDLCPKVFHKRIRLAEHYKNVHNKQFQDRRCMIAPPRPPPPETISQEKPPSPTPTPLDQVTTNQLPSKYPAIWGQLPNSNLFHPPLPPPPIAVSVLPQPFTFPFQSHFENSNHLVSCPNILGISSTFQQLQPFYLDKPIFETLPTEGNVGMPSEEMSTLPTGGNVGMPTEEMSTLPTEGNILDGQTTVELNATDTNVPVVTVDVPEESPELVQQNLLETEKILIPDEPKWESLFEPEINLDDFFDHSSTSSTFNCKNKEAFSCMEMEDEETGIVYSRDKNTELTEAEKHLVKRFIGSRCLSLKLKRLTTYSCKICSVEWHKKDLFEKHCRSIRHWEAIRRIKDNEVKKKGQRPDMEDLDVKRKCSICGIRFSNLKILLNHCRNDHPGQKAFSCELCATAYFNYKHLRHHKATFHKEGDFVCVVCKEKFPAYDVYRKHIRSSHKDVERKCPLCEIPTMFSTLKKLTDHCEVDHPGQKPFSCDICGTTYLRYKDFRNHRSRFHNDDNPDDPTTIRRPGIGRQKDPRTECEICGKSVGNMIAHVALHSGERNQLCDLCGKSFRKKCNLVAHKRRHLGETRFPCTECAKQFYRRRDLRLHYATHNKNYSCTICTQKFATDALLQKHLGLHDQSRPYRCPVCGFMFNYRGNLATHLKKLHPHFGPPDFSFPQQRDQGYPVQESSSYQLGIPDIPARLLLI